MKLFQKSPEDGFCSGATAAALWENATTRTITSDLMSWFHHKQSQSTDRGVNSTDVQIDCLWKLPSRAEDNHLGWSCGCTAHAQWGPVRLLLRLIYHNGACLKGAAFKKRCVLSYCLWAKFDLLSLPVSFMKQKKMRSFGLIKTFFSVYFLSTGARCLKRAEWNWQRQSYLEIRPSD